MQVRPPGQDAADGARVGWGKLERRATAALEGAG